MKRKFAILLVFVSIFMLFGYADKDNSAPALEDNVVNQNSKNEDKYETDYSEFTERILTDQEAGTIESIIDYGDNLILGVHYPVFEKKSIDGSVKQTVDNIISDFKNRNKEFKASNEEERAMLNIDFATYLAENRYVTVLYKVVEYSAEMAHPNSYVITEYYDLKDDKKLNVEEFCTDEYLQFMSKYCDNYFKNSESYKDMAEGEEYLTGISPKEENYKSLIFKKDGVEVVFQKYQLFAGYIDITSVLIPIEKIKEYLIFYQKQNNKDKDITQSETVSHANLESNVDPNKPMIALTFDDGPSKKATIRILDSLKENNGRATFFVLGNRVGSFPDIVKRMVSEGSEIGNHTYNHPQLTKLSADEIKSQIYLTDQSIMNTAGFVPLLMRPTYGSVNDTVKESVSKPMILWSIDTLDWKTKNKDKIAAAIMNNVKDGDIILMHDLYASTADACQEVIPKLVAKGYQLVTVSELLEAKGINPQIGKTIGSARKK